MLLRPVPALIHMKILFIQDHLRCGGTEQHTVFLAGWLQKEGHETTVMTFRPGGILAGELAKNKVRHISLQPFDFGLDWWAPLLALRVYRESPDLVLCMGKLANCYAGFLQKIIPGIPVVSTVRTGKDLPFLYRWSLRRTAAVLVNCQWWKERLVEAGLEAQKIHVTHNPLARDFNWADRDAQRSSIRNWLGVDDNITVFVNVANFRPGKRHVDLIDIFALMLPVPGWQLWLIGSGAELERCRLRVDAFGLEHNIQFFGHQDDPFPYYAGADIAVSASLEDSLPNFLIEAQRMGLPVVATDYRGVSECFEPDKTGFLVPPGQNEEFSLETERLLKETRMREKMGRLAVKLAKERFCSQKQSRRILEILKQISTR